MRTAATLLILAFGASAQDAPTPISGPAGLVLKDGVLGSEEAHALAELHYWIAWGDFDLAEAAYRLNCRELSSAPVRLARSWCLLRWSVATRKGFERVVAALEEIPAADQALRDHVAALVRSVRAVMPCRVCDGKARIRCTVCHGRGERTVDGDESAPCDACDRGERRCPSCDGPRPAPALEDICTATPCGLCEGRGLLFKAVRLPCGECRGLGQKLVPRADPARKLP